MESISSVTLVCSIIGISTIGCILIFVCVYYHRLRVISLFRSTQGYSFSNHEPNFDVESRESSCSGNCRLTIQRKQIELDQAKKQLSALQLDMRTKDRELQAFQKQFPSLISANKSLRLVNEGHAEELVCLNADNASLRNRILSLIDTIEGFQQINDANSVQLDLDTVASQPLGLIDKSTITHGTGFEPPESKQSELLVWYPPHAPAHQNHSSVSLPKEEENTPCVTAEEFRFMDMDSINRRVEVLRNTANQLSNLSQTKNNKHEARLLNNRAADIIVYKNNLVRGLGTLDVHNLFVYEAVYYFARRFQLMQDLGMDRLKLVTGRGLHSENGAKLKPAMEEHMNNEKILFEKIHGNDGALLVHVTKIDLTTCKRIYR